MTMTLSDQIGDSIRRQLFTHDQLADSEDVILIKTSSLDQLADTAALDILTIIERHLHEQLHA